MPASSEVHGLVALMQIQASRSRARVGPSGDVVLLGDQDRSRWDDVLIEHGLAALVRGEACLEGAAPGPYLVEAAIAACHARARHAADTDWARIAVLYDLLMQIAPSPIVALNRAVAHGKTFGPERGLALTATLVHEPALRAYPFLPSVRAAFFHELGRHDEAQAQIARAIALTRNAKEKALLHTRALAYAKSSDTP